LDNQISDKFGFTENEVKQILQDFKVTTEYEQVKKWYDGYKFGKTTDIYYPWSILNYAQDFESGFKPFWVNTSSDELIKERLKERDANYTREQLLKLINNETIEKSIDENFVFPDLDTDKELLWTLLIFRGYLTTESKLDYNTFNLKIPNYEIKLVFKNIIKKWLSTDIKIKQTLLINTTKYLISKDIVNFEKGFKEIIEDVKTWHATSLHTKGDAENIYQSYVLGLLAIIGDDYIIRSNKESGEGRYDIMLIPHDKSKVGIVIEIKQITRNESETDKKFHERIDNKINEALNQIRKNKYYMELLDNKVSDILELPIIFAGKEPYITLINKEKK